MKTFDLVVIGTGSAGATAAHACRKAGWNVAIILINRGEPRDAQAKYLQDCNLATGTLLTFLDDPDDSAYRAFGGYGMPVTAFITKGGRVAGIKSGLMMLEEMRARIQQLLSAP